MHLGRALILIAGLSGPASADSLADMRQDLAGLLYEIKISPTCWLDFWMHKVIGNQRFCILIDRFRM